MPQELRYEHPWLMGLEGYVYVCLCVKDETEEGILLGTFLENERTHKEDPSRPGDKGRAGEVAECTESFVLWSYLNCNL